METIPIVDLLDISSSPDSIDKSDSSKWIKVGKQLGDALHQIGFVYLKNHAIDYAKVEQAFNASKDFFEQPIEHKETYKFENSPKGYHGHGGYNINSRPDTQGQIQNGTTHFELRESFDFTGKMKRCQEDNGNFHDSMVALQEECKSLVKVLLKLIAIGLELEDWDYFIKLSNWIDDSDVPSFKTFRSLYYPAIPESITIPEGVSRVKEHSDFDFITLLFQDFIGGLEVKTADGNWIPATPIPGTVILNIGDLLEAWTGGFYPATKHRVLIPESEIKKRTARQSIVYFLHPDSNTLVTPVPSSLIGNYYFKEFRAYEHTKAKLGSVKSY